MCLKIFLLSLFLSYLQTDKQKIVKSKHTPTRPDNKQESQVHEICTKGKLLFSLTHTVLYLHHLLWLKDQALPGHLAFWFAWLHCHQQSLPL